MSSTITTKPAANDTRPVSLTLFRTGALQVLNKYEVGAIRSLVLWVAMEQGTTPEIVERVTEVYFEGGDFVAQPRKSYDDVLRFLLNLGLGEMRE